MRSASAVVRRWALPAFASNANYAMRCDALTPVWLSVCVAAGALLLLMAWANPESRGLRIAMAVVAGGVIVAGFVHFFPQCLGRPKACRRELEKNWLNNVREAKPIYKHPFRLAFPIARAADRGDDRRAVGDVARAADAGADRLDRRWRCSSSSRR